MKHTGAYETWGCRRFNIDSFSLYSLTKPSKALPLGYYEGMPFWRKISVIL